MSINSCSSCSSSDLATQYAEQLISKLQDRRQSAQSDPGAPNQSGAGAQTSGATSNGLGENVGTLVNTTA
jgi:hypothetical protein